MKKLYALLLIITALAVCGCASRTPEPKPAAMPSIPREIMAVKEITPSCMEELENELKFLTINDFLHADRIAMFEKQGFTLSVENIALIDCNTINFDLVISKKFEQKLILPATGMLMYQYLPWNENQIAGLEILWGNLNINDNQIAFANIDSLSIWNSDSLQQVFRQPDISSLAGNGWLFIMDAVKSKAGYSLLYFSQYSTGIAEIGLSGNVVDKPITATDSNGYPFGAYKVMESRNFNTLVRAETLIHCFFADETEKRLLISYTWDNEYSGNKYTVYDFEKSAFINSYQMLSYQIPPYDFDVHGICFYENSSRSNNNTIFVAEKKENGKVVDMVIFKADIDAFEFGNDNRTGWNTYSHVTLSEDMNQLDIGCSKTNTVITVDFATDTAQINKTSTMPKMLGVDNSPSSMHLLYRAWDKQDTKLVVRILSGGCRMDYITDVNGRWGIDWLAGFDTHQYIYVLTKDAFKMFKWEGSNYWNMIVHISGEYEVTADKARQLCDIYILE